MWNQARNAISMFGATVTGLEIVNSLSRSDNEPRLALGTIGAVVTALIEGFQGKLPGEEINTALSVLRNDLAENYWKVVPNMVEKFRGML
jgi:hypothetical protein